MTVTTLSSDDLERKNILNELRRIGRQDLIDKLYGKRNK